MGYGVILYDENVVIVVDNREIIKVWISEGFIDM